MFQPKVEAGLITVSTALSHQPTTQIIFKIMLYSKGSAGVSKEVRMEG